MQIQVHTSGFDLTPAIAAWTHAKVARSLRRLSEDVSRVDVYLKDLNGPKGGADKEAALRLKTRGSAPIFVDARKTNLYAAIESAASSAKRCLQRSHKKQRAVLRGRSRELRLAQAIAAEL